MKEMSLRSYKNLTKNTRNGIYSFSDKGLIGFTSKVLKSKTSEKENAKILPNLKEPLHRNESLKRKSKSILFHSNGLLPSNEIFWIHKRWKTCVGGKGAVDGLKSACEPRAGQFGETDVLDPSIPQPRVVIVGAGLAGLSAAARLAQAGYHNFQIIEATDRLGGRIHSCWMGDAVAELGPLWLSKASQSNPLYGLASEEGLLRRPLAWRVRPKPADTLFLAKEGRAVEPPVVLPAARLFARLRDQAAQLFDLEAERGQGPLADFLDRRLQEESPAIPEDIREGVLDVFWSLCNEFKIRYGAGAGKLSSGMFGSQVSLPGGALRVPLGLAGILGPLLNKIDKKCILYGKAVESVCWKDPTFRAVVRLSSGETVRADYVLLTVPLGVLKSKMDTFFSPCLPQERRAAIKRLGWATINRFVLSYENPFWLPGGGFYRFVWSKKDRANKNSWIKGLSVVEEVPGAPNLLTFVLGDEEAAMTEGCADDSIAEEFTKTLRTFSGDISLPYPKGLVRSKWGSEAYFLGSSSYLGQGSGPGDHCELGGPLPAERPVLLFAGEATAPGHAASLLGAHLSGLREAARILALVRQHNGLPNK